MSHTNENPILNWQQFHKRPSSDEITSLRYWTAGLERMPSTDVQYKNTEVNSTLIQKRDKKLGFINIQFLCNSEFIGEWTVELSSKHVKDKKCMKGRDNFGDIGVYRRIILRRILKKYLHGHRLD
jgi:hypothetical protein